MNATSKNRMLIFIIALLVIINLFQLAYFLFFSKRPHTDKGSDSFVASLKREVGFTDAQLKQFYEVKEKEKNWDKAKADMDRIRNLKLEIFELTKQPRTTAATAANILSDSIAFLQKRVEINAFNHMSATRSICTPQQQPAFDSLIKKLIRQGKTSRPKPTSN